jgi:hypothetical protein
LFSHLIESFKKKEIPLLKQSSIADTVALKEKPIQLVDLPYFVEKSREETEKILKTIKKVSKHTITTTQNFKIKIVYLYNNEG